MCQGSKGTLFVGNRGEDNVYAITDRDKDGKADDITIIASHLNTPNGVAFHNGSLYGRNRILRCDDIENGSTFSAPVVVCDRYPDKTHHGWKF